ncbi:Uncharacterised protein [Mycobacteroides abscessus subsp. abscessus]|nr:Uncharacterised protein [Mycobacteroides abscessus subsp. abscessus]
MKSLDIRKIAVADFCCILLGKFIRQGAGHKTENPECRA